MTSHGQDQGHSPYATGGGGVTFERRVAVLYLARLLTGATAAELHGRRVSRVSFQQAPMQPDDLVVRASREDGSDPLILALAVRRTLIFTEGNAKMQALWADLLEGLQAARTAPEEHRLGICTAGSPSAAREVAELCDLAGQQSTAAGFVALVRKPRAFRQALRERLDHLLGLTEHYLLADSAGESRLAEAKILTWELLSHLEVVMPRLEPPDETDWARLLDQLEPWTGEHTIEAAMALRDRLASLAASHAPAAADIDIGLLRRHANDLLDRQRRLRVLGWGELRRLDSAAQAAIRLGLGSGTDGESFRLPRSDEAQKLRDALSSTGIVLVTGQSGVGKSALVLGELAALSASSVEYEVVLLNLRQLPPTMMQMRQALGAPLEELLAEMSAPKRLLVIDAADVVAERDDQVLSQLLQAARQAGVTPWVVASDDGRAAVREVMDQGAPQELSIGGLSDAELGAIAQEFPQLRRIVGDPRASDLLRRPAIVDLILRSGTEELPLSDAEAFEIVWKGLIRGSGSARGLPDSRDRVMRQLAAWDLSQGAPDRLAGPLDQHAVAGLKHDGILRSADGWQVLPTFAHDILRTYALARFLLGSADPLGTLIEAGASRWALPAARLVVQVQLSEGDSAQSPAVGRFGRVQASVDRLSAAGHGDRWSDLPSEAVLTLPNARDVLAAGWPSLVEKDAAGLSRLLRVLRQRHGQSGIVEPLVAEPVVGLLFEHGWPSFLENEVNQLVSGWLRGCVSAGAPPGNPLRIKLRRRFVDRVVQADAHLAEASRQRAARLAARSPEQVAADEARFQQHLHLFASPFGEATRRPPRPSLPAPLQSPGTLAQLALLSVDLGEEGAALLRRVAADAPDKLAPAVEGALTGQALAAFDITLLVQLVDGYYVDVLEDEYDGFARATPLRGAPNPFRSTKTSEARNGGAEGIRTLDPHVANVVLSQLSYRPIRERGF